MDVYVDKQNRVWIIGFSEFSRQTDSLLYEWPDLENQDVDIPKILVVELQSSILPRDATLTASRAPSDFSLVSENIFTRNCKLLQKNASSSDSDDSDHER